MFECVKIINTHHRIHNDVHGSSAFLHLHRFIHSFLHLQNWQMLAALGRVVLCGSYRPSPVLAQPHEVGDGRFGHGSSVCPQTRTPPPWYVALFTCCTRAALLVNHINIAVFLNRFFSSFVDGAGPIVNEDDKSFNTGQHVFQYGARCKWYL